MVSPSTKIPLLVSEVGHFSMILWNPLIRLLGQIARNIYVSTYIHKGLTAGVANFALEGTGDMSTEMHLSCMRTALKFFKDLFKHLVQP